MASESLSDADRILRSENGSDQRPGKQGASQQDHGPDSSDDMSAAAPARSSGSLLPLVFGGLLVVAVAFGGLGVWWTFQPAKFDIETNRDALVSEQGRSVPGAVTVATVIRIGDTLVHKPGGYLSNDVTPPGALMDNMPFWEYGVLTELRDTVRALRNDFSRSQTQSIENDDLEIADSRINFDANAWFLPSAEEQYNQAVDALQRYLDELSAGDPNARFYPRADNLRAYLMVVEKRLGSYGQRLSSSVGDAELTAGLGLSSGTEEAEGASSDVAQTLSRTPWDEVDNVFFEARGYSWALLHTLKALAIDFAPVLQQKNAEVSMQQVIRDLEQASLFKRSPMVLNGHGLGVLANHSLVLASYMSRANAALIDLRALMERG